MVESDILLNHRLTRRKGFTVLAGAVVAFVAGCGNKNEDSRNVSAIKTQTPGTSPTEVSPARTEAGKRYFSGVEVEIDSEGLPVKYTLPTDQTGFFDRSQMRNIREKAIAEKEVEFAAHVPWDEIPGSNYTPSAEKPRTPELPKDVMTEQELLAKGVEIIQGRKKLFIRKQAFETGGPLEAFNGSDRKLILVPVDGPYIGNDFMADAKYDRVIHIYGGRSPVSLIDVEGFKSQVLPRYEQGLEQERNRIKNAISSGVNPGLGGSGILFYKEWIYLLKEAKTSQDMFDYAGLFPTANTLGQYFGPERSKIPNTAIIFFAVGKNNARLKHFFLKFEANGKVTGEVQTAAAGRDRRPYPEHTHPNPADYPKTPDGSPSRSETYAYMGNDPGRALNHEIKHDKYNRIDSKDQNEYFTDTDAMEVTSKGYEKWRQSGFTDDSGYYFVWELDEEFGGGYILTRSKDTQPILSNTF